MLLKPIKKIVLTLISFLILLIGNAQDENSRKPNLALEEYFELPREKIFLHLNKSNFVKGENVWFKGYVFNSIEGKPFKETSNVYVGIYDDKGNQLKKNLFLAKEGYLKGDIEIDSTYRSGEYYIKATTNWMRNFNENLSFVEKIKIIGNDDATDTLLMKSEKLDVQFLSEGGHIVAGVPNTIGVKVLNEKGYGVALSRTEILSKNGVVVAEFSTNKFGHGKFILTPQMGELYIANVISSDGILQKFSLPSIERYGLTLSITNSSYQDQIPVILRMNDETLKKGQVQGYYALIHKGGTSTRVDLHFEENSMESGFLISKRDIPVGINTVTVFTKENEPILERLFFNAKDIDLPVFNVEIVKTSSDSVFIELGLKGIEPNLVNLSASVLPSGTTAYNSKRNILSTFYLEPFLTGFIEQPSYYFKDRTPKKEYELDLLLLNQGWSRYSWNSIFNNVPVENYEFERGLGLNVTVNEEISEDKKFYIFPTENHLEKEFSITPEQKRMEISNFFLQNGEEIHISEKDKKGDLKLPRLYVIALNKNYEDKVIPWETNFKDYEATVNTTTSPTFILPSGTITLNEVVVTENKLLKKVKENINVLPFLKNKITAVDENIIFKFPNILDLIASKGYMVYKDPTSFSVIAFSGRRDSLSLYIDGQRQPNLDFLSTIKTEDIESYFFDRNNTIPGIANNVNHVLYIYFKRGGNNLSALLGTKTIATSYLVENGFERTKSYYSPKYNTFFDEAFSSLGVIHWEPEIKLIDNSAKFQIQNTGLRTFKIFIEGMDADGHLFSFAKDVERSSD